MDSSDGRSPTTIQQEEEGRRSNSKSKSKSKRREGGETAQQNCA